MYPRIIVNVRHMAYNAKKIKELAPEGMHFALVAKVLHGQTEILQPVLEQAGITDIADAYVRNLRTYKDLPVTKWLIRVPMLCELADVVSYVDVCFNSEISTIRALDAEAAKVGKVQKIALMYELGDIREGCSKEELFAIIKECLTMKNIEVFGIAANLSCFGGVVHTIDNMTEIRDLAREIETFFDIRLQAVSCPNSSAIDMLEGKTIPEGVNYLRMGEAIWCGYNPSYDEPIRGFYQDTVTLQAQIVEIKEKASVPRGVLSMDSSGHTPEFLDRGIRKRALLAIGKQDVDMASLLPHDKQIEVLGGCSDYTLLDITDCDRSYQVGDVVDFTPRYFSVLRAMSSDYVEKVIMNE